MKNDHRLLRISDEEGVVLMGFSSPILSIRLLRELERTLLGLPSRRPLVLYSPHPSIFLAGAHLGEIAALDAASSGDYAERGRRVLGRLVSRRGPVVAAVTGTCSGGGVDLVLSCDAVVLGHGAALAHPGVRRGLVTGWGGTVSLPLAVGGPGASAAVLQGRWLHATELVAAALARGIAADPNAAAIAEARRLAALEPRRIELWRLLRTGSFVDRFRGVVVHNEGRKDRVSSAVRRS